MEVVMPLLKRYAVTSQSQPTINVQVPIPQPVTTQPKQQPQSVVPQPRKPKKPANIPQQNQPIAQQQPIQPQLRAMILPWVPSDEGSYKPTKLSRSKIIKLRRVVKRMLVK
jgi:hypothetical protein